MRMLIVEGSDRNGKEIYKIIKLKTQRFIIKLEILCKSFQLY